MNYKYVFFLSRPRIIRIHLPIRLIRVIRVRFILSLRPNG